MKSSRSLPWSELRTGVVIIVALALLSIGIIQLGRSSGLFTRNYTLYMSMENTLGLKAGSIVALAGIDVGNVQDIRFPTNPSDNRIVIVLKVKKEYMDRIRGDSIATVKSMGLLGDKYVDISVGSPVSPALPPYSFLKTAGESALSSVLSGASTGMAGLNAAIDQLNTILGSVSRGEGTAGLIIKDRRLYDQLADSAANLSAVVQDLRKARGSMGKFIENPALYDNLVDVSAKAKELVGRLNNGSIVRLSEDKAFYNNLMEVSANLRDVSSSSKALTANLEKGNLARLSSDKDLYAKVQNISGRLDAAISKLESGHGSAGKLLNDEKLYNNMNKFFEDADALVLDINKNPKKYVRISIF